LEISSLDGQDQDRIEIPEVYSLEKLPIGDRHIPKQSAWSSFEHLQDIPVSGVPKEKLRILIGSNVPEVHRQLEWRPGTKRGDPVAVRYAWGWTLLGGIPHGKLECNVRWNTSWKIGVQLHLSAGKSGCP
jgi:hypothetical protein